MSVHYKFKTELNFSTITFDGINISVDDLKKAIIDQKRLAKSTDFDLQITNAQTKDVYEKDDDLIPKNTSVLVVRVPISTDKKKANGPAGGGGVGGFPMRQNRLIPVAGSHPLQPSSVAKGVDLTTMEGSEEEKIQAMMNQSTADYDPSNYMRLRGQGQMGRVPPNYRCNKCNQTGHWIKDCTMAKSDANLGAVKKSTGIPRIFMVNVDGPDVPGAMLTPEGRYAVPAVDHAAYMDRTKAAEPPPPPKPKIPEELVCSLCQDLLTDALLVPCCANSYCDECIRTSLVDSADHECPGCHEKDISPTSLIPNRFLRTAVNAFKNETGYSKPLKMEVKSSATVDLTDGAKEKPKARSTSVSLDDLPEDLFPHSPRKVDDEKKEDKEKEKEKEPDSDDLYDFNDMPTPPSGPREQSSRTLGNQELDQRGRPPFRSGSPHRDEYRGDQRRPLGSGMPLPPGPGHYKSREPLPPGFDDGQGDKGGDYRRNRYDDENRPPPHLGPLGPMMGPRHPMGMPQFPPNMNMMPPGFMPPPLIGPPGMFPGPMGPMPPFMHPHFGPMGPGGPPPHMFPGGRPPYHPDNRDRDRYGDRDRDRDRDRERERDRSSRSSYPPRRDRAPPREDDSRRDPVPGAIEDPLKEFERIMREKDRLKEIASATSNTTAANPVKRSPSFSPSRGHSPASPFIKRPSRSPANFSRSPSPKRSRMAPPPTSSHRRNSYSRSASRSPRRHGRSRTPPARAPSPSRRRSPRRAPPFSPSPPRFSSNRKPEKHDYHHDSRARYESSRHHSSKPYDRDRHRDSRPSDRDRDRDYDKKYESSRKYGSTNAVKKYESSRSSVSRGPPNLHSQRHGSRDRDGGNAPHPSMEQSSVNNSGPPSLFDLNIKSPPHMYNAEGNLAFFRNENEQREKEKEMKVTAPTIEVSTEVPKEHHHHHGSTGKHEEKKVKKEKKKHKKKTKEEKAEKGKKKKKTKEDQRLEKTDEEGSEFGSGSTSRRVSGEDHGVTDTLLGLNELPLDNSLVVSTVAPVLCDSTVKSPEHLEKEMLDKLEISGMTKILEPKQLEPLLGVLDVGDALLDFDINDPKFDQHVTSDLDAEKPDIPPSKWDRDDEVPPPGEVEGTLKRAEKEVVSSKATLVPETSTTLVTSEVLKRAESAIFEKKSSVAIRSSSGKRRSSSPKSKSEKDEKAKEKVNEKRHKTPERSTGGSLEAPPKRSVRDRLGSKVDEPTPTPLASVVSTTSSQRSREPEKSTAKTVHSEIRRSSRDRERDRRGDRGPLRDPGNPGRKHSRSPAHPQQPGRRRSRSNSKSRRDLRHDGDRTSDRSRQDPRRDDRGRDRSPRRDRSRERSPRRHDRSRGRDERLHHERLRSRTRSPLKGNQAPPTLQKGRERSRERTTHRSGGGGQRSRSRSRSSRDAVKGETKQEKDWKLSSDKFKPISAQQVFDTAPATSVSEDKTPVPLAVRKQKRVNIKLTSSSKAEADTDSSSSAEGDENADKGQGMDEADERKKKKKLKRRKSNSSSESESTEDEKKSKKKAKKKKKKKSKKKKSK